MPTRTVRHPLHARASVGALLVLLIVALGVWAPSPGGAAQAPVGLGTADNVAILAGQGVTNTGPTTVNGDLGTWPNPAITGAGLTVNGATHAADAVAQQAQADTTTAYNDAAGRSPVSSVATELGGQTLTAGVYGTSAGTMQLTGTLTLDAQGEPSAVFVLQASSTLTTATSSTVKLINGAGACNVFWQVGSSATLGTSSTFRGTILALTSITVTTGVTIEGRALARNGAVTLDTDTITRSTCAPPETTGTTLTTSTNPAPVEEPITLTATLTAPSGTPGGTVVWTDDGTPLGSSPIDSSGTATLVTTSLGVGDHHITATYLGAPGFEASSSNVLIQHVTTTTTTPADARPATPVPATPNFTG